MKINKLALIFFSVFIIYGCKKKEDTVPSTVTPNDFLAASKYDNLIIQIQAVSGYDLQDQTITNLTNFLQQRLNKPGGIQVVKSNVNSSGKSVLTLDDVKALEKTNRTEFPAGKTLTAYFYVADVEYSKSTSTEKVLGVAYSPTSMVLFGKSMQDFSGDFNQPSATALETTVIEHEFCHILGLVNNGTTMQTNHQDEPHGKHCNNTSCLMYYEVEGSQSVDNIFGNGVPTLDNNCINDLRANGGK
jgi:hypothetical protein